MTPEPEAERVPTLVYLYGPPAAGKLTIAENLAALTGYRLFHNHLTVNAVRSVFEFGTPPFAEVLHRFRLDVFATAMRTGVSMIFTNNSLWGGSDGHARFAAFAADSSHAVGSAGGRTLFVRVTAPLEVLERRVANDTRRAHGKLLDGHCCVGCKQDNPPPQGRANRVCESVRASYLGRSESPISDSASDRKAPRRLNATVPINEYRQAA